MKKHHGMRPLDIVVLLKICAKKNTPWLMKNLAQELGISSSEISESLNRSIYAGLLSADKKKVMKQSLLEFLEFGLKYVFPQQPGAVVRGIPTAYSALPVSLNIHLDDFIVWPYAEGKVRGQAFNPLHPGVPRASLLDPVLYELLALVDTMRIGKARERKFAKDELNKQL